MADLRLTHRTIPDDLWNAKKEAAGRLLPASTVAQAARVLAVSADPRDNVVGVGVGPKITNGRPTNTNAVRIYVAHKIAKAAIPDALLLPDTIAGVPTDVVETGRFKAQVAAPPAAKAVKVPITRRRFRPIQPGCSTGFQFTGAKANFVMAGTLGAIVEANGIHYILSNNHVLADENNLPPGSPIFQPGLLDNGNPNTDQVATLTRFIRLDPNNPNDVDCAIAQIMANVGFSGVVLPKVGALHSNQPIDAVDGMNVHKVGRTTGYTQGRVFDVSADVVVQYDMGNVHFQNQVLVRGAAKPFSDRGDSGSLIVNRDTQRATALLFAGSASHTIANHFSEVLAQLQVTLTI